jgi:membrane protease YdiL (CAAX protease family)
VSGIAPAAAEPARDRLAIVLGVAVAAALWSYFYDRWQLPPRIPFGTVGLVLGGDVLPLLGVPLLVIVFVLRDRPARYGWRWPGGASLAGHAALAYAALLPFALWLSAQPEFQAFYPSRAFPPARQHLIGLGFLWVLHHAPQLFATESLFRGFLLLPLARALGLPRAAAAQAALYVLLHASKPSPELVMAAWGGLVFAWVAWRTRSFLPAFAAHWAIAVTVDALCFRAIAR